MADRTTQGASADRLRVFISSTIEECASERRAANEAIRSLNFEPIQFERAGARAEAPREFYLRKLQDAHIVLGIYRESYGWIDDSKGMLISGLEDEFREAQRLGKDFLAYVLKPAPGRDERLGALIAEMSGGPHVLYFFEQDEDLEPRLRDDLTALVTDRVTRAQTAVPDAGSAASTLGSIFRDNSLRVRRNGLQTRLSEAAAEARIVWVTGQSGAGKTALVAEWSQEHGGAYVNARGMDARSTLLAVARSLGVASRADMGTPLFDDARSLLTSRWADGVTWPLIVDDPDDPEAVWAVLGACLAQSGIGSVIIAGRDRPCETPGKEVVVPGFTDGELEVLRQLAGGELPVRSGDLPVTLRASIASASLGLDLRSVDAAMREMLGYIALSPTFLQLDDLLSLLGGAAGTATEMTERLAAADDLLIETAAGYGFIHQNLASEVSLQISKRPQLNALLVDRLSNHLAQTGRAWAAFRLRQTERSERVARLANRTVSEAVFSGSTRHLTEALEYLAEYHRSCIEPGRLVSVLMSLAEARANQGRMTEAELLLNEATETAASIGDRDALMSIEQLQAAVELRWSASEKSLARVQLLRDAARAEGRKDREARLLLDEGIARLSVNDAEAAIPLFRSAREIFGELEDDYGSEIATRNLIASLSSSAEGRPEADALRAQLRQDDSPRHRAWLCNILVPRLRRDHKFAEAEEMAREAIGIGIELGDRYLVAINQITLGNVLRDAEDLSGARQAYSEAGRLGQSIGRPDIDGRASRLLASTDNQEAESADKDRRHELGARAEQYASHAVGLLAYSFAWVEQAFALEERGDALRIQGRDRQAMTDYAAATFGFLRGDDAPEAERLLGSLLRLVDEENDAVDIIAAAFGGEKSSSDWSETWVEATTLALARCPKSLAPATLGRLVRAFMPGQSGDWWIDCLVRCLLDVDARRARPVKGALGSTLLLAILGYAKHRAFTTAELLTLAGICATDSENMVIRHRPGGELGLVLHLGGQRQLLFTVRTEIKRPEAVFVALTLGAFLDAFAEELAEILAPDVLGGGAAIDVTILPGSGEKGQIGDFFREGLKDRPVATARISPKEGEEPPIVVLVRSDAIEALQANERRGGEFEVTLARFLDEVVHVTTGRSVDDEIFSSKIRDVLVSVLR